MLRGKKECEYDTKLALKGKVERTGEYAYYSGKTSNEEEIEKRECMESRGYRAYAVDIGPTTTTEAPVLDENGHEKYKKVSWEDAEGEYHQERYALVTYMGSHKVDFQYGWYKLFRDKEESDHCAEKEKALDKKLSKTDWVTLGRIYRYENENPKVREMKETTHVDFSTIKAPYVAMSVSSVVLFLAMLLGAVLMIPDITRFLVEAAFPIKVKEIPEFLPGKVRMVIFASVFLLFGSMFFIAKSRLRAAEYSYSNKKKPRKTDVLVVDYLSFANAAPNTFKPWGEMKRILQRIMTPVYIWVSLAWTILFVLDLIGGSFSHFLLLVKTCAVLLFCLYLFLSLLFVRAKNQMTVLRKAFIACNLDRQYYEKHLERWKKSDAAISYYKEYCAFRAYGTGLFDKEEKTAERKSISEYEQSKKFYQKKKEKEENVNARVNFDL